MKCPKCAAENPEGEHFCVKCGASLTSPSPAPASVTKPSSSTSHKQIPMKFVLIGLVVLIAIAAIFMMVSGPVSEPTNITQPETQAPLVVQELNEETKAAVSEYGSYLVPGFANPFNLDSLTSSKLSSTVSALEGTAPVVVFNGVVYSGLDYGNEGGTYYLKPKGSNMGLDEGYIMISDDLPTEEELFNLGDETQNQILQIVYSGMEGKPIDTISETEVLDTITSELSSYLESQKSLAVLTDYELLPEMDEVRLYYPGDDIPWSIRLFEEAYVIYRYPICPGKS